MLDKWSMNMNWMDTIENNNSVEPIEFNVVKVDHNISLAEAIQLSVEKSGYEVEFIETFYGIEMDIKIPFLVGTEDDMINVNITRDDYTITIDIDIRRPNTIEEKLDILEYVNDNNGFISFSWNNEEELSLISIWMSRERLDAVDMLLEHRLINIEMGNAYVNDDKELIQEKLAQRGELEVYRDEDLEFNLSGEWNATHGFEYRYILRDINELINAIQEERENILRFT